MNLFKQAAALFRQAAVNLSPRARMVISPTVYTNIQRIDPPGTDLEIYTFEDSKGRPHAAVFQGKAGKPLWHYYFRSENEMNRKIEQAIIRRKKHIADVAQAKKERKEFQHDLKLGDILYASWGYDQTNINFYQVVGVRGKMVDIREVASKIVSSSIGSYMVAAVPNKFIGQKSSHIVGQGNVVKLKSFMHAYKWDGRPLHETAAGWGH